MGRAPCCSKVGLRRGPWTPEEDALLTNYIQSHGEGNWRNLPKNANLLRCGKSCRLRWMNYVRPDIKRGNIGPEEKDLIIRLHALLGNRWSLIAGRLPGRTDNEIKNYWNSHLSKIIKVHGFDSNRTRKTSDDHQEKRKKRARKENPTKTEIHTPKAIRVTSAIRSPSVVETSEGSDCKTGSTSSTGDTSVDNNFDIDWTVVNDGGFWFERDDTDHGLACEFPSQDNLLDRVYQEYSKLLDSEADQFQINPFTGSLFV